MALHLALTAVLHHSTLLEHQTSRELGRVTQLVEVVQLALSLLHKLLTVPEAGASVMLVPVGHAVRSTPAGARPTLLCPQQWPCMYWDRHHHKREMKCRKGYSSEEMLSCDLTQSLTLGS